MKTNVTLKASLKTAAIILVVLLCSGKIYGQSDQIAYHIAAGSNYSDITIKPLEQENISVSDFITRIGTHETQIHIRSLNPVPMKVRVYSLTGDLAKEESVSLNSGSNELNIDMDNLQEGVYIVQFYSKEGSAIRRIVKMN